MLYDEVNPIHDPLNFSSEDEQELFYSKLKELPESIVSVLFRVDTPIIIGKICKTAQFSDNQSRQFVDLVRKVLTGEVGLLNFPAKLSLLFGYNPQDARKLTDYVAENLFAPVLNDLESIQPAKTQSNAPAGNDNVIDLRNINK